MVSKLNPKIKGKKGLNEMNNVGELDVVLLFERTVCLHT